jgi:hypothetical protein
MGAVDDPEARVFDQYPLQSPGNSLALAVAEHDDRFWS